MEKMNITTLKNAGDYIKRRSSFRASNLWAVVEKEIDNGLTLEKSYTVYSYATVIYREVYEGFEEVNRLNEYFSRSTSRHQSIVKRALNIK